MQLSKRYRVNVSTSVKGVKTYDCTVDLLRGVGDPAEAIPEDMMQEVLAESDRLVAELDKRYPAPSE